MCQLNANELDAAELGKKCSKKNIYQENGAGLD